MSAPTCRSQAVEQSAVTVLFELPVCVVGFHACEASSFLPHGLHLVLQFDRSPVDPAFLGTEDDGDPGPFGRLDVP